MKTPKINDAGIVNSPGFFNGNQDFSNPKISIIIVGDKPIQTKDDIVPKIIVEIAPDVVNFFQSKLIKIVGKFADAAI